MSKGRVLTAVAVLLGSGLVSEPAEAQPQSMSINAGYFSVRGEDGRIHDDVLIENLNLFAFDVRDFNNGAVGGEWHVGLGDYLEAGVGLGYYVRTVPSVYNDFVNDDGSEIFQDFRLRITPLTFALRVFPFSTETLVQPYFGAGLGGFNWRYSEVGEFIDFTDFSIFRDRCVADGTDIGGLILGGVRFPVGDRFALGGELRYQQASGHVGIENGFLNDRIDLGGLTSQFVFQIKF